jgi:hypothetical protein
LEPAVYLDAFVEIGTLGEQSDALARDRLALSPDRAPRRGGLAGGSPGPGSSSLCRMLRGGLAGAGLKRR